MASEEVSFLISALLPEISNIQDALIRYSKDTEQKSKFQTFQEQKVKGQKVKVVLY